MNIDLKKASLVALVATVLAAQNAVARTLDIKITNLSHAINFTPLLVTAHRPSLDLFEAGEAASAELQQMAEGGNLSGLNGLAVAAGAASAVNPAGGLLGPGDHVMVSGLKTKKNKLLSLVAMMLPTNDGFVGLDSWTIPKKHGRYTLYLNAYDAGTEVNNELITGDIGGFPGSLGIPGDPGGNSGTGGTGVASQEHNTKVHIHRGVIGDSDLSGGNSDLDARVHHWHNPVAKVEVWVK
ncbi:MAG: spondin domain-containing protein [Halopseudomonas sp.]